MTVIKLIHKIFSRKYSCKNVVTFKIIVAF